MLHIPYWIGLSLFGLLAVKITYDIRKLLGVKE